MSCYQEPRFKKMNRLGSLPGLTSKKYRFRKNIKNKLHFIKKSPYCIRLEEKQKLRFYYGIKEQQLLKYVQIAGKTKESTGQILLKLFEMRLDNILFKLGIVLTIPEAKQLVNHRHILVNDHIVDIPSYRCKIKDIFIKKKKKSKVTIQNYIEFINYFIFNSLHYKGFLNKIIDNNLINFKIKINELWILEYYSRQI